MKSDKLKLLGSLLSFIHYDIYLLIPEQLIMSRPRLRYCMPKVLTFVKTNLQMDVKIHRTILNSVSVT